MFRRVLPLLACALTTLACTETDRPEPRPEPAQATIERLVEGEGRTLVYAMADDWGEVPPLAAQLHLVDVLTKTLAKIGQERAAVSVGSTGELRITVEPDAAEQAAAAIEQSVEVRFRIRAPMQIENPEREKRTELADFYAESLPDFAWFPLPDGQDVLLYVPEAPLLVQLEALQKATPRDEAALAAKIDELQALLLKKVFTGADLANAEAIHRPGESSVRVTLRPERQAAFRTYTTNYRTRQMAVLVNGVVIAAPTLSEPLSEAAEIRKPAGTFQHEEAEAIAAAIRRAAYGIRLTRTR